MTGPAPDGRRSWRAAAPWWIDLACIGVILAVQRGLAEELAAVSEKRLLDHGLGALALRNVALGLWSELPDRLGMALAAVVLIGLPLTLLVRKGRLRPGPTRASRPLRVLAGVAAALPVALAAAHGVQRAIGPPADRNVVLVVMDTLRADHLGLYGYGEETSPRLDGLAREAFVFDEARSNASWTRPAIASLLTSLPPSEHGIYSERNRDRLAEGVPTLQKIFRDRGYHAAAIVTNPHFRAGLDRDFDSFALRGNARAARVYDEAIRFLDERGDEPFLLIVHNLDPHDAYDHREGFSERPPSSTLRSTRHLLPAQISQNGIRFDSPENVARPLPPEALAELRDNYEGEIRYLDHHFGRFLDALAARGLLERTVLAVTADHGEEFFDHGSWWHGGSLHDELLRVPLLIRVPGMAGRRIATPVSGVDVLPTLAELASVPVPETARGQSLVPLLHGEPFEPRPILAASGFRRGRIQQSVVWEGHKLIRYEDGEFLGLYDLENDPGELRDLGPDAPLRARLEAHLPPPREPRRRAGRRSRPLEVDPETRRALQALGYAAGDAPDVAAGPPDGTSPDED